jgi:hypothetical protein
MRFIGFAFIVLAFAFIFQVTFKAYAQDAPLPDEAISSEAISSDEIVSEDVPNPQVQNEQMIAPAQSTPTQSAPEQAAPIQSVIEKYADPLAVEQTENRENAAEVKPQETGAQNEGESAVEGAERPAVETAEGANPPEAKTEDVPAPFVDEMTDEKIVVLKSIDKVSALSMTFEIPVGSTVKFGKSLFIKARACKKSSAFAKPESVAFLQIWEKFAGEKDSKWIFSGWMYASSPALSAMEHPVYDVWVLECKSGDKTAGDKEKAPADKSAPAPKAEPEGAEEEIPLD